MNLRDLTWEILRAGMARKIKLVDAVGWCLRVHANERGEAWPSDETMADELGLTPQEIRDAIGKAIDSGDVTTHPGRGSDKSLTIYKVGLHRARARHTRAVGSPGTPRNPTGEGTATRVGERQEDPRGASTLASRPEAHDGHPIGPGSGSPGDRRTAASPSPERREAIDQVLRAWGSNTYAAEERLRELYPGIRHLKDATVEQLLALAAERKGNRA